MAKRALQKTVLFFLIGLTLVGLLLILTFKPLANRLIEKFITKNVARLMDANIDVSRVNVSLLPIMLEFKKVELKPKSGPVSSVELKSILIKPGLSPLFLGKIVVDRIELIEPNIHVALMQTSKKKVRSFDRSLWSKTLQKLVRFEIKNIEVVGAKLSLHLPKEDLGVFVHSGKASFEGQTQGQRWTWTSTGFVERKNKKIELNEVAIDLEHEKGQVKVHQFKVSGLGVNLTMKGDVFPDANLSFEGQVDCDVAMRSLFELSLLKEKTNVVGQVSFLGRMKGPWELIEVQSQIKGEHVLVKNRLMKHFDVRVIANEKRLISLTSDMNVMGMALQLGVQNMPWNQRGSFELKSQTFDFATFEKILDPKASPSFSGPISLQAKGFVGPRLSDLQIDYEIKSRQLKVMLEDRVYRFLPLLFKDVSTSGTLSFDEKIKKSVIRNAPIKAMGLNGKYQLEISNSGAVLVKWVGAIEDASHLFQDYPLLGDGQVAGGVTADDEQFEVIVDLNLDHLQYEDGLPASAKGMLVFKKGLTELRNIRLVNADGYASVNAKFFSGDENKSFLHSEFEGLDLQSVANVTSRAYPVVKGISGLGQGKVMLNHLETMEDGLITLKSENLKYKQNQFQTNLAKVIFSKEGVSFDNIELKGANDEHIVVKGLIAKDRFDNFSVRGQNISNQILGLSETITQFYGLSGLELNLNGPLDDPLVDGTWGLSPNPKYTSNVQDTLNVMLKGPSSNLNVDIVSLRKNVLITGQVDAKHFDRFRFEGHLEDYSLAPLLLDIDTHVDLSFSVRKTQEAFESLNGRVDVKRIKIKPIDVTIQNKKSVQFDIRDGDLTFLPFELSDSLGTKVIIEGGLLKKQFDLKLDGKLNLMHIKGFDIALVRSEGMAQLWMSVKGFADQLSIKGQSSVSKGFLQFDFFAHALEDISAQFSLDQRKLKLESLKGEMASGEVSMQGELDFIQPSPIFSINGNVKEANLRYPQWLPATVSGDVFFEGSIANPLLKGNFVVSKAVYEDQWDFKSQVLELGRSRMQERVAKKKDENIRFDLSFDASQAQFRLNNDVAKAQLLGHVRLLGSDQQLGMLGKIDVLRGEVEFLDNRFELSSGVITFNNASSIEPVFDLNAKTRVGQTDIFLDLRTQNQEVIAFLSSQPAKDETSILSLLTLGLDTQELLSSSQDTSSQLSSSILPGILSTPVQSKLQKGLQEARVIDSLQFVPYFSEQQQTSGLKVFLGKKLSNRIRLLYSTDLFDVGSENTLQLRQDFNDNISLQSNVRDNRTQANEEVDVGVDLEFKFDF